MGETTYRQRFGRWGEEQAKAYLVAKGYQVLTCNFRAVHDEIDLVCLFQRAYVFVEVKTRASSDFVHGEYAVNPRKLRALKRAAQAYLTASEVGEDVAWQIDTVVVEGALYSDKPSFLHFENVGASLDD